MICEFSIAPLTAGESLSKDVSRIIDVIDGSGLPYRTHAMGTLVEGDWEEIIALVKRCHEMMRHRHNRVLTTIRIDDRAGAENRLTGKIQSIETHLKRKIQT